MRDDKFWYVIKLEDETCSVEGFDTEPEKNPDRERWGSFKNESEAIAKKIGLIRAGKCKPQ